MDQNERLDYLVKAFKEDSERYRDMEVPNDPEAKRQILRSLMNIRMPGPLPANVIQIQNEYLQQRAREKGIVTVSNIPTAAEAYGSRHPHAKTLSIWQGDISRLACDAIVNAANSQMLGCFVPMHACIDNCIHSFAGVQLRAECNELMTALINKNGPDYEQPTAVPLVTDGYNLPCRKVIHIAGPIVMNELTPALEKDLADCYTNALDLCLQHCLRSIAFCCISTGLFRFPNDRAAEIAVSTVSTWLDAHPGWMDRVIFNVFKDEDRRLYEQQLS